MDTTFREATPSDASAIARVHVASWRTTYNGIVSDDYLTNLSESDRERMWLGAISDEGHMTFIYVAESEGDTVGFASAGPERTQDPDYQGELYAIYLLEPYQRQGIGTRLITCVVHRLLERGCGSMLVWVLANNPYWRFYDKLGGKPVREQMLTIGDQRLVETAYGWQDLRSLYEQLQKNRT